jgi:hypothetical protein
VLVIACTVIAGGTAGTRHTLTNAYRRRIPIVIVTPDGHIATYTPTQPHDAQRRASHAPAPGDTPLSYPTRAPTPEGDTR